MDAQQKRGQVDMQWCYLEWKGPENSLAPNINSLAYDEKPAT